MIGSVALKFRLSEKIMIRPLSYRSSATIFLLSSAPFFSTAATAFAPVPTSQLCPSQTRAKISTNPSITATVSAVSNLPHGDFVGVGAVRKFHRTAVVVMAAEEPRKAGVASPPELRAFVEEAGDSLLVIDVRNPDASVEPGDQKSLAVAALPSDSHRPRARHLIWDRSANSMPLPEVSKDTPIITHCGGGGRGQKAKDFLVKNGFTKVLNGGGPKETDCWKEFGDK